MYDLDPELSQAEKEYNDYMNMVENRVNRLYNEFLRTTDKDIREKLKNEYISEIRALTIESDKYNKIVEKSISTISKVNQKALDKVNQAMPEIYTLNYNQVAEDCRKVGIKVDAKVKK